MTLRIGLSCKKNLPRPAGAHLRWRQSSVSLPLRAWGRNQLRRDGCRPYKTASGSGPSGGEPGRIPRLRRRRALLASLDHQRSCCRCSRCAAEADLGARSRCIATPRAGLIVSDVCVSLASALARPQSRDSRASSKFTCWLALSRRPRSSRSGPLVSGATTIARGRLVGRYRSVGETLTTRRRGFRQVALLLACRSGGPSLRLAARMPNGSRCRGAEEQCST